MAGPVTREYVSQATGFDSGDQFESEEQVRDYFSVQSLTELFGECIYSPEELAAMVEAVLDGRWHCAFAMVIPCCECPREFDPEDARPDQEPTFRFQRCDVVDGTVMCPTCLYDKTAPCLICNETVRKTAMRQIADDEWVCTKH